MHGRRRYRVWFVPPGAIRVLPVAACDARQG
ncbi:hypothetical protein Ae168Ps1_5649c [Pseudonocardia sp. Ae168_Ps1]|nr:hypothetical protein Ae168Ps1_5649c [Pseudonocardia sp. Ae168_Ps1]